MKRMFADIRTDERNSPYVLDNYDNREKGGQLMLQSEYLELAIELYDIYSAHDIHHRRWLTARELQRIKGGPGLIAKVKSKKGKMSELKPIFVDYVNTTKTVSIL